MSPPLANAVDLRRIGAYRGEDEILAAFGALRGVRAGVAGTSREGRALRRFELGEPRASATLVLGGIHAMEWIGVESALALATRFADRPAPGRRLVCLPIVNADGYARVEADLRAGRRRYVRANAAGVDLNRNFPTHHRRMRWRALVRPLGSSGDGPASEPETRAVLDTLAAEHGRIDRAVSLHSFGRKVLVPFGGRWRPPDDLDRVMPLAKDVGARLGYDVVVASHWLPGLGAFGLELDHLHASGPATILVECSAGGFSFRDPSSWLHPFRWYNPPDPDVHAARIADALVPFAAPPGRAAVPPMEARP